MMGHEVEREYGPSGSFHEGSAGWRRTSWAAIFAGAFVTMAIFITLQLLGAGIGASALDLTGSQTTSPRSLGIGAAIWWFITGLIALFIGGWVAGRLGWRPAKLDRALHGLTVWAVFYIAMFLLVTTALGAVVGGGISLLGSSVSAAGEAAGTPQGQQALGQGQQALGQLFGGQQPGAQQPGASQQPGAPQPGQQEQAKEQAKETGEKTANITGGTLIGLSLSMLIGAIVAVLGSLAAAMPPYVPPYQREREHDLAAHAEERTYAGTR